MAMFFNAIIRETSLEKTKEKGTQSVCLWLELLPNAKDGFLPEGVSAKQYAFLWLTDKTIERSKKTLRDLGWQGRDLRELHFANPLENVECSVTGDFADFEGERRFKVQWVNAKKPKRDIGEGKEFAQFNKFFADGTTETNTAETETNEQLPF